MRWLKYRCFDVVGIDVGCGVTLVKLKQKKAEFQKLDKVIRENVPCGFGVRKKPHRYIRDFDFLQLNCVEHVNVKKAEPSLGTLGGGNHFLKLDQDEEGNLYAAVHSGSRRLGKEVTEYYLAEGRGLREGGGACDHPGQYARRDSSWYWQRKCRLE